MTKLLILIYSAVFLLFSFVLNGRAWSLCSFNDGSLVKTLDDDVSLQTECMFLTGPLEWNDLNPNTFDGPHYNRTGKIPLVSLPLKRIFISNRSIENTDHVINYWLLNGGGGSQYGMESFGISMFREILRNNYHKLFSKSYPMIYLYQYRGGGLSKPSIHCYTAMTWVDCARELIETTVPASMNDSLRIIHAMSNENIAQDLQYQIQYVYNETESSFDKTYTYIYGLSQGLLGLLNWI